MPIDFSGIPTTRGRGYKAHNLNKINEGLKNFLPIDQRAAILGSIIEESGGNPNIMSDTGAYQGLLQWGADRYIPKSTDNDTELNNQVQYILDTVNNPSDGKSWTHGGKGSGYNSKDETYNTFHDKDVPFDKRFRAFSYGYVRPQGKEDSYSNRLKIGREVLNKLVVDEILSKPNPYKIPRFKFGNNQFVPKKFSDGGDLDNSWNSLSMKDKAEMMRVAIANGITTLPEIREAYNKFAEGGYKPSSSIKRNIANWEGSSMKTNRSFEEEAEDFNRVIPAEVRSKLTSQQLDGLYSYGYNVGMGNLKKRVLPTLTAYTQGRATKEDVQRSMWASKDNELRGLTNRRNWERQMFGGNYKSTFTGKSSPLERYIDPSDYELSKGFFDGIDARIANIPQVPLPDNLHTDPTTLYKPPVINDTLIANPKPVVEEPVYNPRQEKQERLQYLNTVLGLMGQQLPILDLASGNPQGLLSYVNQIYS